MKLKVIATQIKDVKKKCTIPKTCIILTIGEICIE